MAETRRELFLKLEILRSLSEVDGCLEPEDSLLHRVRLTVQSVPLLAEFSSALRELEIQGLVTGLHPALGGPVKWRLTDKGRSTLSEHE